MRKPLVLIRLVHGLCALVLLAAPAMADDLVPGAVVAASGFTASDSAWFMHNARPL